MLSGIMLIHCFKLLRYRSVLSIDGEWGSPNANGTGWTGVVGMVMREEILFGLSAFFMTSARNEVVDMIQYGVDV